METTLGIKNKINKIPHIMPVHNDLTAFLLFYESKQLIRNNALSFAFVEYLY